MSIFVSGEKVPLTNVQSIQQPLSSNEINKKISSIGALQIALIGSKIIEGIMNNVGAIGKARVAHEVTKVKGLPESSMGVMYHMTTMHAKMDIEKGKGQFLSGMDIVKFILIALGPIEKEIAYSFSTPSNFLEHGLYFKISDDDPMGFVSETAKQIGINITLDDVPSKYYVTLKLDEKLTQEKSDLVFSLAEESEGVEFSKKTFTVGELEQEFCSRF